GRDRLTELLGVEWGEVSEASVDGGNGVPATLRVCFSTGAPAYELIEAVPGTRWECNEESNLHHVSYFPHPLAEQSDRLAASGCPVDHTLSGADGAPILIYHRDALGVRIELLSEGVRASVERHQTPGRAP